MAQVKCSKCQYINPLGVSKCQKCGNPLPNVKLEDSLNDYTKKSFPSAERQKFTPSISSLRRGETFAGRYTVIKLIGRGGMGSIYKVFDNTLKEEVALKLLLPQFAKDPMIVERFLNEARIARKLSHPNIIRVHDIGISGNILYISMEFIEGKSLREILDSLPPGQRMPLRKVLQYFDQLCSALEYAHQFTVHRDIKPENIMINNQDTVKLMDFGISKLMADTRLTGVSVVMGTPFYMSPEQVKNSRDVDARSDIYSCGVMLYEILTGQVPTGIPRPASELVKDLPPELDKIVEKCIQPDPKDRFQSATELRNALQPLKELILSGGESSGFTRPTQKMKSRKWVISQKVIGGLLIAMTVIATSGGLLLAEQYRSRLQAQLNTGAVVSFAVNESDIYTVEGYINILFQLSDKVREKAVSNPEFQTCLSYAEPLLNQIKTIMLNKEKVPLEILYSCARYLSAGFCEHEGMVLIPEGTVSWRGKNYTVPAFFIDVTEVTVEKYAKFCANNPEICSSELSFPSLDSPPSLPVTMVSFYEALNYAVAHQKNLPTVIQWLRASQGESKPQYPWGDNWKDGSSNIGGVQHYPQSVGSYQDDKSAFGCYDMLGNVAEWTSTPASEECDVNNNVLCPRIVMGGDYSVSPQPLTQEKFVEPDVRSATIGFRCVKEIPISPEFLLQCLTK